MRSSIAERSGAARAIGARRGFHLVDRGREFLALRPRRREFAAQRGERFFQRLHARRGSRIGRRSRGLAGFGLQAGDARGEIVDRAALSCGAGGAAGWIAGQPSIQPTPITSAAATAPETGATIQGETGAGAGRRVRRRRWRLGRGFGVAAASLACAVSLVTSVASRSMVGGARLGRSESGSDPCFRACHRPSQRFP